jgi:hypothetical protein
MVLPGVRTDPRRPGGMPDSGSVNPGGPIPSVPQATRQPNMGAGVGEPDPKKIEEMFTQYTTGQITREDLLNYLHGESEGRGGILGLLEGMQEQGMGQPKGGTQPNQAKHTIPGVGGPGGATVQGGLVSPGAASVTIPKLEEPLDARHQKISTMLQGYGLGPADADQLSTILNPHVPGFPKRGHEDTSGEGLGLMDSSAGETTQTWADKTQPDEMATRREEWSANKATELAAGGNINDPMFDVGPQGTIGTIPTIGAAADEGVDLVTGGGGVATDTPQTSKPVQVGDKWYLDGKEIRKIDQETGKLEESVIPGSQFDLGGDVPATAEQLAQAEEERRRKLEEMSSIPTTYKLGQKDDRGWVWDGTQFVDPKAAVVEPDFTGEFGDIYQNLPASFTETAVAKFMESKGSYSAFAGGNFKEPQAQEDITKWQAFWRGLWSGTAEAQQFKALPVQDETTGEWFPNADVHNNYKRWLADEGTYYGGGTTTFSHWEDADGNQVAANTPGAVGVGNNMVGIDVTVKGVGNTTKVETFYFPEDDQEYLDKVKASLAVGWLPFDENGEAWPEGSTEGWLPGYGPNGFLKQTTKPKVVIPKAEPKIIVTSGGTLPPGWEFVDDGSGILTPVNKDTGEVGIDQGGGKWSIPTGDGTPSPEAPVVETPATAAPGEEVGLGPTMTDLDLRGAGNFPMMNDFLMQLELGNIGEEGGTGLTAALAQAVTALEVQKSKEDIAADQRLSDVVVNDLDRVAVTARADADRKLQAGAAIGKIEESLTLAAKAEQNKAILEQSKISGLVPTMGNEGMLVAGTEEGLESRVVTMTETEKTAQRQQNMTQLFGQWMPGDPETAIATLERDKFGLTKAIAAAEISGKIPEGYAGAGGDTLAAKRMAWERDVARQNANTQTNLAFNGQQRNNNELAIANNKINSDQFIASGQLAEAVESRKDATFLAKQRLDLEREKMKLDTLTALSNPATYLFAVRYGLLEQIGGTLGISWGDDVIASADLPRMVQPGTFPSMTDFQRATPVEREIMLAEVASSGGFTTDEAVRMIMEGAPGGRDVRRTSLVGVSR